MFQKTVTPTTSGEAVVLKEIYETTTNMTYYVGCVDDDFSVTGWRFYGGTYTLVTPSNIAFSDTTSATGLAGSIIPVSGFIDLLYVKPMNTTGTAIMIQGYTKQ